MRGQSRRELWDDPRIKSRTPQRFKDPTRGQFGTQRGDNPCVNPEHLLVLRALTGTIRKRMWGRFHGSNPELILVFKVPWGERSGT